MDQQRIMTLILQRADYIFTAGFWILCSLCHLSTASRVPRKFSDLGPRKIEASPCREIPKKTYINEMVSPDSQNYTLALLGTTALRCLIPASQFIPETAKTRPPGCRELNIHARHQDGENSSVQHQTPTP